MKYIGRGEDTPTNIFYQLDYIYFLLDYNYNSFGYNMKKEMKFNTMENKTQVRDGYYGDLSENIQSDLETIHHQMVEIIEYTIRDNDEYKALRSSGCKPIINEICQPMRDKQEVGSVRSYKSGEKFSCMIQLSGHFLNHQNSPEEKLIHNMMIDVHKQLSKYITSAGYKYNVKYENEDGMYKGFDLYLDGESAKEVWDLFEGKESKSFTEAAIEYNTDMSEIEAKRTLRTLSQSIINDGGKVTQYTVNIYSNIITKNLIQKWGNGYRKLSITLDTKSAGNIFEFKIPAMTQDFVSRFIDGKETLEGLLRRKPEIKVRMSASIFNDIKSADDPYNFFKAAIIYYSTKVERYAEQIVASIMKMGYNMKHLISHTKLSGLVTLPLSILFVFDNVDMSQNIFKIDKEDINKINAFIRNIPNKYAAPEKEKKEIVEDLRKLIEVIMEAAEPSETTRSIRELSESVAAYLDHQFDEIIATNTEIFISENVDREWMANPKNPRVKVLKEAFGVKKLKKIPRDTIAYIQIEAENISTSNDKFMIASYCLDKLEIVEWYIELLDTGSKKYVVPHDKKYLTWMRTELLRCYKLIMNTKVRKPGSRPIIDIKYPKGYEG